MTIHHGKIGIGRTQNPPRLSDGTMFGGVLRGFRELIPLEGQRAGDAIYLFDVPKNFAFRHGRLICDRLLPGVAFSIGTPENWVKYRALGELQGDLNTPIDFGQAQAGAFTRLEKIETVMLHIGAGAFPMQGLLVVDMTFVGG